MSANLSGEETTLRFRCTDAASLCCAVSIRAGTQQVAMTPFVTGAASLFPFLPAPPVITRTPFVHCTLSFHYRHAYSAQTLLNETRNRPKQFFFSFFFFFSVP